MIDADIGDYTDFGGYDIGAIEASAKTYFDDCYIDILLSEIAECHCCGDFEERWLEFGNEGLG